MLISHARSLERTGNNLHNDTKGHCCEERFQVHGLGEACSLDTLFLGNSLQLGHTISEISFSSSLPWM